MKNKKTLNYLWAFLIVIVFTYSITWILLLKLDSESKTYKYKDNLNNKIYSYNGIDYFYGPKDETSSSIGYNNSIIKKDKKNNYKVLITLNDFDNTLMEKNHLFYKNYFYLISDSITIYNLSKNNVEKTKKVIKGYFTSDLTVDSIYGIKNNWIYIKAKLYKENDSDKWYSNKYFKIKYDGSTVYEIPEKLIPKFK